MTHVHVPRAIAKSIYNSNDARRIKNINLGFLSKNIESIMRKHAEITSLNFGKEECKISNDMSDICSVY